MITMKRGQTLTEYLLIIGALGVAGYLAFAPVVNGIRYQAHKLRGDLVENTISTSASSVRFCDDSALRDCHK
jgi:hypothetical protein